MKKCISKAPKIATILKIKRPKICGKLLMTRRQIIPVPVIGNTVVSIFVNLIVKVSLADRATYIFFSESCINISKPSNAEKTIKMILVS